MEKFDMNDYKKVVYIRETNKEYNCNMYYRQEFLLENIEWSQPKPITKKTFDKRTEEGYEAVYKVTREIPQNLLRELEGLNTMIDLSLTTGDKKWFKQLVKQKTFLLE